ncbi:MAG: TatD family hydrolase [Clostridia bacterium]
MSYFDTHAHYNDDVFKDNLDEVLQNNKKNGVKYIINVGYNKKSSQKAIDLSLKYEYMYSSIGIHPHDVDEKVIDIYNIYQTDKKIVAIGEIGLDYAFVSDNKRAQTNLFIEQIELANALKLPIIIHSRDAKIDTYNTVKENKPQYGALFHCFQPCDELTRLVLERGYSIAVGGNITYKRNESFAKYIKQIPIDKIVVETDCPYLSPVPFRGSINTSANLPIIVKKLAEYKEMQQEDVENKTFENSIKFFKVR